MLHCCACQRCCGNHICKSKAANSNDCGLITSGASYEKETLDKNDLDQIQRPAVSMKIWVCGGVLILAGSEKVVAAYFTFRSQAMAIVSDWLSTAA